MLLEPFWELLFKVLPRKGGLLKNIEKFCKLFGVTRSVSISGGVDSVIGGGIFTQVLVRELYPTDSITQPIS